MQQKSSVYYVMFVLMGFSCGTGFSSGARVFGLVQRWADYWL